MNFFGDLENRIMQADSLLCVGLDPDTGALPAGVSMLDFNREIIAATSQYVCAYKLNFAFYEAAGAAGWAALKGTLGCIPSEIPVIADAKRADIGNTARAYARAIFDELGFDAVTVNPYLGGDAVEPFLERREKGVYILCRTSNPGAADIQNLRVQDGERLTPLFQAVAERAAMWNIHGNVGLVVGATAIDDLRLIRRTARNCPSWCPASGRRAAIWN
jgi:orotidine-5'-phosphate decarboxylase